MAQPSIYLSKTTGSVKIIELNLEPFPAIVVLAMVRSTPSGVIRPSVASRTSSSVFTMFSPLLPRNNWSAVTYEPIFTSTLRMPSASSDVGVISRSDALLPPTKMAPSTKTGFSTVPLRRRDTCSALGRTKLRASTDSNRESEGGLTPAFVNTSTGS